MIVWGLIRYFMDPTIVTAPNDAALKVAEGYHTQSLNLFLLLGAFSNGCAALTGIEAISNGVTASNSRRQRTQPRRFPGWRRF